MSLSQLLQECDSKSQLAELRNSFSPEDLKTAIAPIDNEQKARIKKWTISLNAETKMLEIFRKIEGQTAIEFDDLQQLSTIFFFEFLGLTEAEARAWLMGKFTKKSRNLLTNDEFLELKDLIFDEINPSF